MDINTSRMSIQSKIVKSNLGKLRIPDLHEMVRFIYMKFHISYTFLAPGKISEKQTMIATYSQYFQQHVFCVVFLSLVCSDVAV